MLLGSRIRALRDEKKLSPMEIQERTGLQRSYLSRLEHGHTTPSIQTLEKLAQVFEMPVYKFFYDGKERPEPPAFLKDIKVEEIWGNSGKSVGELGKFRRLLSKMTEVDRNRLFLFAQEMAKREASRRIHRAS